MFREYENIRKLTRVQKSQKIHKSSCEFSDIFELLSIFWIFRTHETSIPKCQRKIRNFKIQKSSSKWARHGNQRANLRSRKFYDIFRLFLYLLGIICWHFLKKCTWTKSFSDIFVKCMSRNFLTFCLLLESGINFLIFLRISRRFYYSR